MPNENTPELKMTFTPNTIEHLGVRMYATLPPVIAELIANSYDADATTVTIHLLDLQTKEIVVTDNGHGMSFTDINQKFLRIGRNRRVDEISQISPLGRKVIGKKGLGKLSFFGIAHEIEIVTVKNGLRNSFIMNWDEILLGDERDNQRDYSPVVIERNVLCTDRNGTKITLKEMTRINDFNPEILADSLVKFFIFRADFNVSIKHNEEPEMLLTNERKYSNLNIELTWNVPEATPTISDYHLKSQVVGQIFTTKNPIAPSTNMKGITLFSRGKLVNLPEYFSQSTSSFIFTYLTGWLEVDFIDELGEDVIGTNRQSLNWEHPELRKLREYLQSILKWIEADWREKRNSLKRRKLEENADLGISEWREHIPDNINKELEAVVDALLKDSEVPDQIAINSLRGLQNIIRPYPYFHWQNLHPVLHEEVFPYYRNSDYFHAVTEGVKRYIREIQIHTGFTMSDGQLIRHVFYPPVPSSGQSQIMPAYSVTKKYLRPNGTNFDPDTHKNIGAGHGLLAYAIWMAFRHPLNHENHSDLKNSDLFSDQDCLDALAALSHLFKRLYNSEPF